MAREIVVKVGRRLGDAELARLDPAQRSFLHPTPLSAEAEGQKPVYEAYLCPWCGAVGYAWTDDEYWTAIYCVYCGRYLDRDGEPLGHN